MYLISEIGYHDRDIGQYLLEFSRQPIDRVDNQRLELIEFRSIGHCPTIGSDSNGAGWI